MDYPPDKPIFATPLVLAENDETPSSTSSEPPRGQTIPRGILNLIGKVGLRYEPSVKSDLDAHAARVALLAEDVADAEPWKLQQAIDRWVRAKPFLPKASELREIMAEIGKRPSDSEYVDCVGPRNEMLAAKGSHLRWAWNNPNDWAAGTHLYSIAPLENKLKARLAAE